MIRTGERNHQSAESSFGSFLFLPGISLWICEIFVSGVFAGIELNCTDEFRASRDSRLERARSLFNSLDFLDSVGFICFKLDSVLPGFLRSVCGTSFLGTIVSFVLSTSDLLDPHAEFAGVSFLEFAMVNCLISASLSTTQACKLQARYLLLFPRGILRKMTLFFDYPSNGLLKGATGAYAFYFRDLVSSNPVAYFCSPLVIPTAFAFLIFLPDFRLSSLAAGVLPLGFFLHVICSFNYEFFCAVSLTTTLYIVYFLNQRAHSSPEVAKLVAVDLVIYSAYYTLVQTVTEGRVCNSTFEAGGCRSMGFLETAGILAYWLLYSVGLNPIRGSYRMRMNFRIVAALAESLMLFVFLVTLSWNFLVAYIFLSAFVMCEFVIEEEYGVVRTSRAEDLEVNYIVLQVVVPMASSLFFYPLTHDFFVLESEFEGIVPREIFLFLFDIMLCLVLLFFLFNLF